MQQFLIMMMLGIGAPSIAPGLAQPDRVGEVTPAKTSDERTENERRFQGSWQLTSHGSGSPTGTLRIDGREFSADTIHGSYVGTVTIRPDLSPAQIDFTIRGCECKFEGMTSAGIYYEDGGDVVLAFPPPGEPRLEGFTGLDEQKVMLVRATRPLAGDGETR